MHRQPLLRSVEEYLVRFPEERDVVERLRSFIEREPACFERSTTEGHITGSAWLVDSSGEHVLLTHHRKLNAWFQLGGHADGEADVLAVAMQEAREESGITLIEPVSTAIFDIDIHLIPARGSEREHFHYDVRYAFRTHERSYVVSAESHDVAWIRIDRITDVTTEHSMLRMAQKWLDLNAHV